MRIAVAVVLLAACGDNEGDPSDSGTGGRCAPPQGPLPTSGAFIDPTAIELAGCVPDGLRDLAGRWFVVDPMSSFTFEYPQFDGDCDTGFRRSFYADEDHDASDGQSFFSWTDGTRFYNRFSVTFDQMPPQPPFEFTEAFVACMKDDGSLAAVTANFDTDRGERIATMTGKRFGLKDGPAAGLALVGEVAAYGPNPQNRIVGYQVVVDGTHAYLVGPNGFDIVDVANPATPTVVGHLDGGWNDVRVVRGGGKTVAYLAPLYGDMTEVVDATDPMHPTTAATIPEYSHSLQITEGTPPSLYLATYTDEVPRYDISNPLAPVRLGAARVPGEVAGVHDLTVDGPRIYANNTTAGFVAFDVSGGLGTSVELGHIPTSYSHASAVGTTTSGRQVVLHGDEGMTKTPDLGAFLRILEGDRTKPNYMTEIARYQSRPEVGIHNIQLVGNKVYLSYYHDGIRILDIADPAQPREIAHFNTWNPDTAAGAAFEGAVGVRFANDLVYVADIDRGLIILREE